MGKKSNLAAIAALGMCMLMSSLNWMYMRIPQYYIMVETGSDITSWLLSAYIIAEVSVVIVAGALMDRLGPKDGVLMGTSLFFGSAIGLCMADSVEMMIAFRIVQGCGAGFLFTVALGYVGKLPRSKRLDPHKIMTLTFSLGSLFGTAIGYYFTMEVQNWKVMIVISAFIVLASGIAAHRNLPDMPREFVRDVPGMALTLLTIAAVMSYTQMVNDSFELFSYESLAFAELCIILAVLLIWVEKRAKDPVIPHGIGKHEIGLMAGMFLAGFCGLGLLQFLVMFMMVSYGVTLYVASKMLFCLIAGGVVTSLLGMKMVYKDGIRPMVLAGSVMIAIAFMGAFILMPRGLTGVGFSLFGMGLGFGLIITEMLASLQAVTNQKHQGSMTSILMACRFVGIILGMAVYKGIIDNSLSGYIESIEGEVVQDVEGWVIANFSSYVQDIIAIFESTIRECCIAASIAVLSVLIVCYFCVGRKDLGAPEFVTDEDCDGGSCLPAPFEAPDGRSDEGADEESVHQDA